LVKFSQSYSSNIDEYVFCGPPCVFIDCMEIAESPQRQKTVFITDRKDKLSAAVFSETKRIISYRISYFSIFLCPV